ncbi:MAG: hypothetical protein ACR2G5_00345 [Pyrinomonadaceae bacterium]
MNQDPLKLIVAVIASAYFFWCAYDPSQWHLIDGVNLLIHEAGHFVFRPFGEFMMIAGGSLFQVIMPALFVAYFLYLTKFYSAALVLFWVGESILNVSVYAGDSVKLIECVACMDHVKKTSSTNVTEMKHNLKASENIFPRLADIITNPRS